MATLVDKAVEEFHQTQMGRQCGSVDVVMEKPEMFIGKWNQKKINNSWQSWCWDGNGGSQTGGWKSRPLVSGLYIDIQTNSIL